ncbi:MAG TPA: phosphatase PAP2 family protein [Symbiobacteriaceae bacterium]|nr:phosphatase PAP2 family protein [Symbiobacteriaceae bacterium]
MSGLDIIRAIQSLGSPLLDKIALALTDLHSETIYLLVLPLLLWLYDKRFARYMVSIFLLGTWANDVLKNLFHTNRPSPDDVRVIRPEPSYAFPSGHSQNPLMFWGAMAMQFRKLWLTVILGIMIFLIGVSRLYVGVHWPLDLIGGWVIGALILWGFMASEKFWSGEGMPFGQQLFWAVAIPSVCIGISAALGYAASLASAKDAAGHFWVIAGAYYGMLIGCVLEERYVGFDPRRGGIGAQVVKVVVGIVLLLAVKEGFKLFLPATALGDLIRYFFVALSGSLVAPWVFHRFVVATPAPRSIAK